MILIGGGLYLFAQSPSGRSNKPKDFSSVSPVQDRINLHLKNTDIKIQLDKAQIENEIESKSGLPTGSGLTDAPASAVMPMNRNVESHAVDVTYENERNQKQSGPQTPAQLIEKKIARDQFSSDYSEKYQEEYVRQFLDNARDQGMDVELNDDLDVVGVRRRPTERPLRFPNSDAGSPGASK